MSEWVPAASALVDSDAEPATTGELPSEVVPSKNSTVPEGVPAPGALTDTLAVSVTEPPNVDGFGELVSEATGNKTSFTRDGPGWKASVEGSRSNSDTSGYSDSEEANLARLPHAADAI